MKGGRMYRDGGKVKKPKVKKIAIGIGKAKDYPGIKKIIEMNKKGKKRFKDGGSALKAVDKSKNPGLAKLPTQVRNKMGYMKDGGKVKKGKTAKPLGKKPKPGSYEYYLLNRPKHSPAPIKPQKKKDGGTVSSNTKDYKSIRRNTRRMNRLEELGRVDAEKGFTRKGKRNLRAEKKRIVKELRR